MDTGFGCVCLDEFVKVTTLGLDEFVKVTNEEIDNYSDAWYIGWVMRKNLEDGPYCYDIIFPESHDFDVIDFAAKSWMIKVVE